jgi:hypothetical protein
MTSAPASSSHQDVGLGLVGQWAFATVGLQGTYEHLPGIDAVAEQAQVEAHVTPEAPLFVTGIWQQKNVFADFLTVVSVDLPWLPRNWPAGPCFPRRRGIGRCAGDGSENIGHSEVGSRAAQPELPGTQRT